MTINWAPRALLLLFAIAACSSGDMSLKAPVSTDRILPTLNVIRNDVVVPRTLTTTEANAYYPSVDLLWRDDPPGDRHAQVQAVVESALDWGVRAFDRGQQAVVTLEVQKFHALTERARYNTGGWHDIRLQLIVWDVATGAPIYGPIEVNPDLKALGGMDAITADADGRTQKARITQHLAATVQEQLLIAGYGRRIAEPNGN